MPEEVLRMPECWIALRDSLQMRWMRQQDASVVGGAV
jgi:hypothetical protein